MPTKKPAPKKAAKSAAKPVKKAATPVKAAKPAAKPAKKATPPAKVIKKAAVPAKNVKPASKPAPKPATPVKAAKKAAPVKPVAKAAPAKKAVPAPAKPVVQPKKEAPAKPAVVEKIKPVAKPAPKAAPVKEVKVPKTSVKTSVPYNPEYKSLEQRQEPSKTNDPLVRYNDSDLAEFRELINKKLEAAKKELAYLQGLITRKDELGGDEAESRYMTMEDGSMSMEREQLSQMASRQITYIDHLEKALIRIENKTYGICRVTGKLIDKARLRAVPHATLSLEAKLGLVKPSGE